MCENPLYISQGHRPVLANSSNAPTAATGTWAAAKSKVPAASQHVSKSQSVQGRAEPQQEKEKDTKRWVLDDFDIGKPLGTG